MTNPCLLAYAERPAADPETGAPGTLRIEWRLWDRLEDPGAWMQDRLDSAFPGWLRSSRTPSFVVEQRYVRRGIEEAWQPFDFYSTRAAALGDVDGYAVPVDAQLVAMRERAAEEERRERAEQDEKDRLAGERERKREQKRRSMIAFDRLYETAAGRPWCERWNAFVVRTQAESGAQARLRADIEFMVAYGAVMAAETIPGKRKAMRVLLERWDCAAVR